MKLFRLLLVRFHVLLYRTTGGRIGARWGSAPILLLTTTGRRTGKRRTTPLLYLKIDRELAVVATNDGAERHPLWLLNLRSNPKAEVQAGRRRMRVRAREATKDEKARLWRRLCQVYPNYERDQRKTGRDIPVVLLAPE